MTTEWKPGVPLYNPVWRPLFTFKDDFDPQDEPDCDAARWPVPFAAYDIDEELMEL